MSADPHVEPLTSYPPLFPTFGGKSKIARIVWQRLGNPPNYVEPFFGSGALLFLRPKIRGSETANDKDGFISNFFRALKADPAGVANWADYPINEADLHARNAWLVNRRESLTDRLIADPYWFDVQIAGWFSWGLSAWIGRGWCVPSGEHLKKSPPRIKNTGGMGVHRTTHHTKPSLRKGGMGVHRAGLQHTSLADYLAGLAARLRYVRVCCGDWTRVLSPTATIADNRVTAVFLDPPYPASAGRDSKLYSIEDLSVAHDVRTWALENGDNPLFRIALCGYEGQHEMPDTWECVRWVANGGYGNRRKNNQNRHRESVWFSPFCLHPATVPPAHQLNLFGG